MEEEAALVEKIEHSLNQSGYYLVTHPAELRVLRERAEAIAAEHSWTVLRRQAGELIEFFKTVDPKQLSVISE